MDRVCTLPYAMSHRVELGLWVGAWCRGENRADNNGGVAASWAARALNEGKLGRVPPAR